MESQLKLIIFDLDGTILDTLEDLTDSLNYALEKSGFPSRSLSEVKSFVGNGIKKLIERGVPQNTDSETTERVFADFASFYKAHCDNKTKPYDGISKLFLMLRNEGKRVAIVSNKADFAVQKLVEKYFGGLFDFALGEKDGIKRKPAPDMVEYTIKRFDVKNEEAIYVGDSEVDIETASNAKIACVSVSYGFRDSEFLLERGASIVVESVEKLSEILLSK